jgi:hypothetical protein
LEWNLLIVILEVDFEFFGRYGGLLELDEIEMMKLF